MPLWSKTKPIKALPMDYDLRGMTVQSVVETVGLSIYWKLPDRLRALVDEGDLINTAYLLVCQYPTLSWRELKYKLYRVFMPMGWNPGEAFTGTRRAYWGSLLDPIPDSAREHPHLVAWAWGMPGPIPVQHLENSTWFPRAEEE